MSGMIGCNGFGLRRAWGRQRLRSLELCYAPTYVGCLCAMNSACEGPRGEQAFGLRQNTVSALAMSGFISMSSTIKQRVVFFTATCVVRSSDANDMVITVAEVS